MVNLLNSSLFSAKQRLVYVRADKKALQPHHHHTLPPKLTINTEFSLELQVQFKKIITSIYKIFAVKC